MHRLEGLHPQVYNLGISVEPVSFICSRYPEDAKIAGQRITDLHFLYPIFLEISWLGVSEMMCTVSGMISMCVGTCDPRCVILLLPSSDRAKNWLNKWEKSIWILKVGILWKQYIEHRRLIANNFLVVCYYHTHSACCDRHDVDKTTVIFVFVGYCYTHTIAKLFKVLFKDS